MSFNNKVVIVTGGSSGIGASTAIIFAREGANVVVTGRNEANLNSVAEKCGQVGKKAFTIKADVSKDDEAASIIKKTIEKFGKLDVLVNNAGILRVCSSLGKNAVATFDEVWNTNVRSIVLLTNIAGPYLAKSKGNIVNVSSVAGSMQQPDHSAYCTSKAALNHFSRVIAMELASSGVRVNTVSPGPVETPLFDAVDVSLDYLKTLTAMNRIGKPEEIGELIAFVASDKAGAITGSNYVIDCGALVKS